MSLLKRKRLPLGGVRKELSDDEQAVFDVIQSRGSAGIMKPELKRELKTIKDRAFNNCVKSLLEKQKIREVKSVQNKKIYLMAVEFEAALELSGGAWYNAGELDKDFVATLMEGSVGLIRKVKVVTVEGLCDLLKRSGAFKVVISVQQVKEILSTLILDGKIMTVKSTGSGIYEEIPIGKVCYKLSRKVQPDGASVSNADATLAMASMPCGSCPRINQCTPDGAISPITCEYYNKWLQF